MANQLLQKRRLEKLMDKREIKSRSFLIIKLLFTVYTLFLHCLTCSILIIFSWKWEIELPILPKIQNLKFSNIGAGMGQTRTRTNILKLTERKFWNKEIGHKNLTKKRKIGARGPNLPLWGLPLRGRFLYRFTARFSLFTEIRHF